MGPMNQRLTTAAIAAASIAALLAGAGCTGDTAILLPGPSDTELVPEDADSPWGDDSPWDDAVGSSLPEAWFVVAWREVVDSDPEGEVPKWEVGPLRYGLLDVDGRLLASYELPVEADGLLHLGMHGVTDDEFLVSVRMPDTGSEGPGAHYDRRVFRIQVEQDEAVEVLRLHGDGTITLPLADDRTIDLGSASTTMRVAADPTDGDRLLLLADRLTGLGSIAGPIRSIDTVDPDAPVRSWAAHEWLPEGLVGKGGPAPPYPWAFDATWNGERTLLVLGAQGEIGDDGAWIRRFYTWDPESGESGWSLDLSALGLRNDPSFRSDGDGAAGGTALFQNGSASISCADPTFTLLRGGDEVLEVEGSADIDCGWAGPLLEPREPTFAWYGFDRDIQSSDMGHAIFISHEGRDVHVIDRFADLLTDRRFLVRDLVLLARP
jgi:hypothetical protein